MWTRDGNGNKLTFTYYGQIGAPESRKVETIIDSLGRVATVFLRRFYNSLRPDCLKAFGGVTNQEIRIYRTTLGQALRYTRSEDPATVQNYGYLFSDLRPRGQRRQRLQPVGRNL